MNAEQRTIVQRLISDLDAAHILYLRFKPLLSYAHLRFLVSKMIDLHSAIADDLARQMQLTGGLAAHRGAGAVARIRARSAYWVALGSADSEMSCLKRIVRHEHRMVQAFQTAMVQLGNLCRNLHGQLLALELTSCRIESLVHRMEASSLSTS